MASGNGSGEFDVNSATDFVHTSKTMENALKTSENENFLKLLMVLDSDYHNNLTKLDIPTNRAALYMASLRSKCVKHNDTMGIQFVDDLAGYTTSVRAKRANLGSDTVIGDRKFRAGESGGGGAGLMEKMKNFMTGQ